MIDITTEPTDDIQQTEIQRLAEKYGITLISAEENKRCNGEHRNNMASSGSLIFLNEFDDPDLELVAFFHTLTRCQEICEQLAAKRFASTNVVYGIGSYTYNYVTRDTFGFALKSTYVKVDGEERMIMKNPVTDPGSIKKSLTGKCWVSYNSEDQTTIEVEDGLTEVTINEVTSEYNQNMLQVVFEDGKQYNIQTLQEVRDRLANGRA